MKEKEEILMKLGMFEQQIQQLQQQIEAVERGVVDLTSLDIGLDELVNGKDKEIFASVGRGIFVKAKLLSDELNVDIGQGNFIKKTIPETKELIEEQIVKLEDVKKELERNLEKIGEDFTDLMKEAENQEGKERN